MDKKRWTWVLVTISLLLVTFCVFSNLLNKHRKTMELCDIWKEFSGHINKHNFENAKSLLDFSYLFQGQLLSDYVDIKDNGIYYASVDMTKRIANTKPHYWGTLRMLILEVDAQEEKVIITNGSAVIVDQKIVYLKLY